MEHIRKTLCKLVGHNYILIKLGSNEHSVWGFRLCSRCDHQEAYQYDN